MNFKKEERRELTIRLLKIIVIMLLISIMCASPVLAWFYAKRSAIAASKISNPIALYINAANVEDIHYLDLSEIDVKEGLYKDYVFCVNGKNINHYRLQLAHTTNNQFTYTIYPAKLASGSSEYAGAFTTVEYVTHGTTSVSQVYYVESGQTPVPGAYLNDTTSEGETLGKTTDHYYTDTYGSYTKVNKYAVPMYWQSDSEQLISPGEDTTNFVNYYVLRIGWNSSAENDKETDIIYIAAKAE